VVAAKVAVAVQAAAAVSATWAAAVVSATWVAVVAKQQKAAQAGKAVSVQTEASLAAMPRSWKGGQEAED